MAAYCPASVAFTSSRITSSTSHTRDPEPVPLPIVTRARWIVSFAIEVNHRVKRRLLINIGMLPSRGECSARRPVWFHASASNFPLRQRVSQTVLQHARVMNDSRDTVGPPYSQLVETERFLVPAISSLLSKFFPLHYEIDRNKSVLTHITFDDTCVIDKNALSFLLSYISKCTCDSARFITWIIIMDNDRRSRFIAADCRSRNWEESFSGNSGKFLWRKNT